MHLQGVLVLRYWVPHKVWIHEVFSIRCSDWTFLNIRIGVIIRIIAIGCPGCLSNFEWMVRSIAQDCDSPFPVAVTGTLVWLYRHARSYRWNWLRIDPPGMHLVGIYRRSWLGGTDLTHQDDQILPCVANLEINNFVLDSGTNRGSRIHNSVVIGNFRFIS